MRNWTPAKVAVVDAIKFYAFFASILNKISANAVKADLSAY
jgi:hypothetical protein